MFIPKIKNPTKASEYCPISLCNVIYKLASKVIANRLKQILPSVISKSQSAFLPDCLITSKLVIDYEALHTMKMGQKGREYSMALKLDMSKAYD